jgi:hypothetical protein
MIDSMAASTPYPTPTLTGRLFTDDHFEFNARDVIGQASQGVFDLGVAVRTLGRITDGDAASWLREWNHTGDRLRRRAMVSEQAGRYHTAAWAYLGAAEAYARAIAFVDGLPDDSALLPTFTQHRRCWQAFINASRGTHLGLDIAYEHTTLPGYLLRPDSSGATRPTLIITNGIDGALSGLWSEGIKSGLERKWNVFVYDGPGQQSVLYQQKIPFRPDWEQVLTPIIEALAGRSDVDEKRLVALAISEGGYSLARTLAFEHRLVAAAISHGVWNIASAWYANLPRPLLDILDSGNRTEFNHALATVLGDPVRSQQFRHLARPYGQFETPYDLLCTIRKYRIDGVVGKIRTPTLICDTDDDGWFAGQPRQLYDALRCEKELVHYSREDGAGYYCEPWARGLASATLCDFFQKHLEVVGR